MKKNTFLSLLMVLFVANLGFSQCSDLFFSEYIEGSSSNKAMEIYNPTSSAINLTDYAMYRFNNGSTVATDSLFPQGTVAAGDVWVVANPSANVAIQAVDDTTHSMTFYNGDDAIILVRISTGDTLDAIGEIGVDPGTGWAVGTGSTSNFTLVRKVTVQQGNANWAVGATEWDVFPIDMTDSLGAHSMNACTPPVGGSGPCQNLFFSEYIEGTSNNKAIEIYNAAPFPLDLANYRVERFNNGATAPSGTYDFIGVIPPGGVFVAGNPSADTAITTVSDTLSTLTFFNGDDVLILIDRTDTLNPDTIDAIGELGVDPGTNWPVGTGATSEYTLVRKASINQGNSNWALGANEWDVYPQNTFDSLGAHTMTPCVTGPVLSFASAGQQISEAGGTAFVTLQLSQADPTGANSVDVVVNVASTANNPADYTYSTVTVTFPQGSTTPDTIIEIPIIDDGTTEANEIIILDFANQTGAASTGTAQHTITILDNDIPTYPIGTVNTTDANGVADSAGVNCRIGGLVYGGNFRPAGLQFTIIDPTGGIGIFSSSAQFGYTVTEGDSISIEGTISQFNGLTQINPDTVIFHSAGNPIKTPTVVTALDESTESDFIKIDGLWLVDPLQWTGAGSGFNVDVTDGTNTFVMRVDADIDLYNDPAPTGRFNLCGIGGQFDSSSPYTDGYQVFPRWATDIKPIISVDLGADTSICAGATLTLDAGAADTWLWSTGDMTQTITVGPGTYSVTATDSTGSDADTIIVSAQPLPVAGFGCDSSNAPTIVFSDNSTDATSWAWDFGDGQSSTLQNPSVTYTADGNYTVTQIATNICGSDTTTKTVNIVIDGIAGTLEAGGIALFPNPAEGAFQLRFDRQQAGDAVIEVMNLQGARVLTQTVTAKGQHAIDMQGRPAGLYLVKITTENTVQTGKVWMK